MVTHTDPDREATAKIWVQLTRETVGEVTFLFPEQGELIWLYDYSFLFCIGIKFSLWRNSEEDRLHVSWWTLSIERRNRLCLVSKQQVNQGELFGCACVAKRDERCQEQRASFLNCEFFPTFDHQSSAIGIYSPKQIFHVEQMRTSCA